MSLPNSGRLGAAKPAANTWTQLIIPDSGKRVIGTVGSCMAKNTTDAIYIAVTTATLGGGSPAAVDMKIDGLSVGAVPPQLTGLVIGNGQCVYVKSDNGNVTFDFNGKQELDQ